MLRSVLLFLLFVPLLVMWPVEASCGVIRTEISTRTSPNPDGGWDITARITNTGDADTYDLRAFVFVDGWTEMFTGLGDNLPGETIEVETRYSPGGARDGRYTGMARVHFEEKSGREHKVFHSFALTRGETPPPEPGLEVTIQAPSFHPRAFWRRAPNIRVGLRNPGPEPVEAHVQAFLPAGITTPSPHTMRILDPREAVAVSFPLSLPDPRSKNPRFHVTLWYEDRDMHYSRYLEGNVTLEEGPVLFKVYLVAALLVLAGVAVRLWRSGGR